MIASTTNQHTAKTISTLSHHLDLLKYEKIIILDDEGSDVWCRHEIAKLPQNKINIILQEVVPLNIWRRAYNEFEEHFESKSVPESQPALCRFFYSLILKYQKRDKLFVDFHLFLQRLYMNRTHELSNANGPDKISMSKILASLFIFLLGLLILFRFCPNSTNK